MEHFMAHFLTRPQVGLRIRKLRENSQQKAWASPAIPLRNLSPRDVQDSRALRICKVNTLLLFFDAAEHAGTDTRHSFRANISNVSLNLVPLPGSASYINGADLVSNTRQIIQLLGKRKGQKHDCSDQKLTNFGDTKICNIRRINWEIHAGVYRHK